jgi:hypothetical protein
MTIQETVDLVTGAHTFLIELSSKELQTIQLPPVVSQVFTHLSATQAQYFLSQLRASEKLSDKLALLSFVALALEQLEDRHRAPEAKLGDPEMN